MPKSGIMDQPDPVQNVNITGPWSLNLKDRVQRHLDLVLIQNREAVLGHGILDDSNGTQRVTASGSLTGGRLELTAMLVDSLDLYRLNLSLDPDTAGSYTAYSSGGAIWSGRVSGSAPLIISDSAPRVSPAETETAHSATRATRLGLADLGRISSSSSSNTSIGSASTIGTGSVESYSSTSESV